MDINPLCNAALAITHQLSHSDPALQSSRLTTSHRLVLGKASDMAGHATLARDKLWLKSHCRERREGGTNEGNKR